MNGRQRILAVLEGRPADHLPLMPITMMFAADHVGVKYGDYATDYRVLAEAQVRTASDYEFDYVSCISDPTREAADCGAEIEFFENQPPAVVEDHALLADKAVLRTLDIPDPHGEGRMRDRVRAAAALKQQVGEEKLVEGWVEGPCAEAADLRGINTMMFDLYDDPTFVRELFEFNLTMALRFAQAQIEAGADLIGVGDAAASLIGPKFYEEFVWSYEKRLVDGIHQMGGLVRLHICGNTSRILEGMGKLGCDMMDLDFMVPLAAARQAMGPRPVLLGNIDPVRALRDGSPESIAAAIGQCHRQAGPRYIVAAGCEVPRDTPPENVRALSAYARSHDSLAK